MKLFSQKETYISDKMRICGDIETDADISIDGKMKGKIVSKKCVSLGETAHFEGSIECDAVRICGHFIGTVVAKRLIEVKIPATVFGDLISDSIRIDSGVAVQGKILAKNIQTEYLPKANAESEKQTAMAMVEAEAGE